MKNIIVSIALFTASGVFGQDFSYSKPGSQYYLELNNPKTVNKTEWNNFLTDEAVSFASDNIRYHKEIVPSIPLNTSWKTFAWKGEKVHTQILLWSKNEIAKVSFQISDLVSKTGRKIASSNINAAFVRYTLADAFKDGCAQEASSKYDSFLVADPIDIVKTIPVSAFSVQPVWLSVQVPANVATGKYTGTLTVNASKKFVLKIVIEVQNQVLPPPSEWKFDFDIWQYPAPIARMHNVKLWSDEHFNLMRDYFTNLASAGQKVISANIIEQPWGVDHVHFDDPTLIKWTKKKDGSWSYDFSLFDKYISFLMSCGITQRINCYTMITWDLGFIYYDEILGKNKTDTLKPGTDAYTSFWRPMIEQFTSHLKERGWFSKTSIAVDERPVEDMKAIIALLRSIDTQWKIALAGDTYHPEIEKDIYDYCLASYLNFEESVLKRRKVEGKPTTFYTACVEEYPNSYTTSPPAENTFIPWYAAAKGLTGYLFWTFNSWVADPLHDSRWKRYPAGELFQFYPGPRTSIRFEKLREGIQDFEKIGILRNKFISKKDTKNLKKLDTALSNFRLENLKTVPAAVILSGGKKVLYQLSRIK